MSTYLSSEMRLRLLEADDHRCAYCRTTEKNSGQPMVVDHLIPVSLGGITEFENLCFSCRRCNEFKGGNIQAEDPLTGAYVSLFNPREQQWDEHFRWDSTGIHLVGLTAVGRATIVALRMNNQVILSARRRWVSVGWHPPEPYGS